MTALTVLFEHQVLLLRCSADSCHNLGQQDSSRAAQYSWQVVSKASLWTPLRIIADAINGCKPG